MALGSGTEILKRRKEVCISSGLMPKIKIFVVMFILMI